MTCVNFSTKKIGFSIFIAVLALCLAALSFTSAAYAQTSELGRFISTQEVYDNPDDHQLNLDYAKQEIQRGEMLNAASALERMLYGNPDWHSARLLYAAVLYRLDDSKAAMRELSLLKGRNLDEQQIQTLERYQTQFETPLPPLSPTFANNTYAPHDSVKGSIDIGLRGDDNAGNALTDEGFGFDNQGDLSLLVQGRLALSSEITETNRVAGYAVAGGQIRRHREFSQADYDVIDLQAGIRAKPGKRGSISLGIDARQVNISSEKYLQQIGPRLSFNQSIGKNTKASVSLSAYYQDYDVLSIAPLENERDGYRTRFQVGLQKHFKPTQKLTAVLGYDTKTADIGAFAYRGPQASLGFENRFKNGIYSKSQIQIRRLDYSDSFSPDVDEREDTRVAIRQAIGLPLKSLANSSTYKTAAVEFGVNYNERASNIDTNDYDNLGVDVKLKLSF